jgi:purine-binding chemotaxis protein CheW
MTVGAIEPSQEAGTVQLLTFSLGVEQFGIRIHHVKEIIEYRRVTSVPTMPAWVRGVINLRGVVVPVLDLALRLDRPAAPPTPRTCIVVIEIEADNERRDVGVVVDAVSAVIELPANEIESSATVAPMLHSGFVCGMGKTDGRFVILLDPEKVLADSEPALSKLWN